MRRITTVLFVALTTASCGKTAAVIPHPQSIEISGGRSFVVTADTVIVVPPGDERVAAIGRFLSDLIGIAAAPAPPRVDAGGAAPPGSIVLALSAPSAGDEGYELSSRPSA